MARKITLDFLLNFTLNGKLNAQYVASRTGYCHKSLQRFFYSQHRLGVLRICNWERPTIHWAAIFEVRTNDLPDEERPPARTPKERKELSYKRKMSQRRLREALVKSNIGLAVSQLLMGIEGEQATSQGAFKGPARQACTDRAKVG